MHDRLAAIVGGAMGYEPEDLPWEVPLIELGLDSLMAVRIKNRVEYDFDLPPIQLTAVRDANLYAVEKLIEYAIEHRDEVEELARAPEDADTGGDRGGTGRADGRSDHVTELEEKLAEPVLRPRPRPRPPHRRPACRSRRHRPTRRARQAEDASAAALAAQVLTQEAVTEALGADVPPREAAERVTFATWAIVTGKSPGGIFNALPRSTTRPPRRWRQRLSERAEGTITAEDVKNAPTIEALATIVREHLEAGELDGFVRTSAGTEERVRRRFPVFVFHPAGGSTVVYEPLLKRLPAGHPDVRHRAGRGLRRGARRASTCRSCWRCRATARSSWRAGRLAACWHTPARSGSSRQAPTCGSSG